MQAERPAAGLSAWCQHAGTFIEHSRLWHCHPTLVVTHSPCSPPLLAVQVQPLRGWALVQRSLGTLRRTPSARIASTAVEPTRSSWVVQLQQLQQALPDDRVPHAPSAGASMLWTVKT